MIGLIGVAVLLCLYGLLIFYYFRWWKEVPHFDSKSTESFVASEKISVIVPARNEEEGIEQCIRSLLAQSYPKSLLEIIIVDDHSTDETAAIVKRYAEYGVQLISLQDVVLPGQYTIAFKKKAIEAAIRKASGTLIVTTDADCTFHENWLRCLASFHRHTKSVFIVAPVKIKPDRTLLSGFQCLDFAILQGITAASVHHRFHSMCNGANLAYEKDVFQSVNGFEDIDHIASGDDMLLMQKIKTRYPNGIAYLLCAEAVVETQPAAGWRTFFHQRVRWASKTGQYKDKRIAGILLLVYLLNLCLFILLAGSIWYPHWLLFFVIFVLIKTIIEWRFVGSVLRYFRLKQLMRWFLPFQPLHIVYIVVAGFFSSFKHYDWKGRRVR